VKSEASPLELIYKPFKDNGEKNPPPYFTTADEMQATFLAGGQVFAFNPKEIAGNITEQRYLKILGNQSKEEVLAARKASDNIVHGRYVIIVDISLPRRQQAEIEAESERAATAGKVLGSYIYTKRPQYNLAAPCFCSDGTSLQKTLVKVLDGAQDQVSVLIEKNQRNNKKQIPPSTECLHLLKNMTIVVLPCSHEVKPNKCSDELPAYVRAGYHTGTTENEGTHSIDYTFYRDHYKHASTPGRRSKRKAWPSRNPNKCVTSNNLLHQIFIFLSFEYSARIAGQGGDGKSTQMLGGSRRHRGRRKRKTARKRRRSNKYHNNRKTGRTRTRRGRR
jgi:hypothetical protein